MTVLEANIDVQSMEVVIKRKLPERETASSECMMLSKNSKKNNSRGPQCFAH